MLIICFFFSLCLLPCLLRDSSGLWAAWSKHQHRWCLGGLVCPASRFQVDFKWISSGLVCPASGFQSTAALSDSWTLWNLLLGHEDLIQQEHHVFKTQSLVDPSYLPLKSLSFFPRRALPSRNDAHLLSSSWGGKVLQNHFSLDNAVQPCSIRIDKNVHNDISIFWHFNNFTASNSTQTTHAKTFWVLDSFNIYLYTFIPLWSSSNF